MAPFPLFLSIVVQLHNQADQIEPMLAEIGAVVAPLVQDYELIVVDNASLDDSVAVLKYLTGEGGQPNLQVYVLTKQVNADTAIWVGLEHALGDFVAVIDPMIDDVGFLSQMLDQAVAGAEVVFARNDQRPPQGLAYRAAFLAFNRAYQWFNGVHLAREAPQYRLLSRSIVNFILQHRQPALTYRHLPASGGFAKASLSYTAIPRTSRVKRLGESVDNGMRLLVSTTQAPMRIVTTLSLFGAVANLLYSIYVVAIGLIKADVAPGWISMSLQQSGMFFLISLVLLVLGEYILNMASLTNEGPRYHVAREFTSARMTRQERLNVEETVPLTRTQGVVKRYVSR
ncbi:MAG: glycosyltransferase [Thiotrichales bacterium]